MPDLDFDIQLSWSGTGREGAGRISTDDLVLELSAPESMGGRGVGTNPEELLVSAVSSCYTATLFEVLKRSRLPVSSLTVEATGTVAGFPSEARFDGIVVNPMVLGGDPARQDEYEAAAARAHDRCFIGRALASDVDYEVGSVTVREDTGTPSATPKAAVGLDERSAAAGGDDLPSVGRAA